MAEIQHGYSASRRDDSRLPHLELSVVRKAQLTVAENSGDAEEASMLLAMLGIHPDDWSSDVDI